MAARLELTLYDLAYREPFRIARQASALGAQTFIAHLQEGERPEGVGEAWPDPYYGEDVNTVPAVVPGLLDAVKMIPEPDRSEPEAALRWLQRTSEAMDRHIGGHGAAKAAIDIALHDRAARELGLPLCELFGQQPVTPATDFSIGIDEPAAVAERARRAARFPFLKIKLGGPADLETLEAVRAVFDGPIRVDANLGWEPEHAARLVRELVRLGVELIEQPFPRHRLAALRWLQERSSLPVVADESAITIDDLEILRGVVAGVNVKVMKCGGVGPAYRMLRRARELGFKVMLGCMLETSVGIAAGAAVAGLADWVDLDGNLQLADDPYEGLLLDEECRWRLEDTPGLGIHRKPDHRQAPSSATM